MLVLITQDDVIYRRVFDKNHRSCVPNFGCCIKAEIGGKMRYFAVSRQMVLFAVERRKAWRMLQSKAGVSNKDYLAQKALLTKLDKGECNWPKFSRRQKSCSKLNWRNSIRRGLPFPTSLVTCHPSPQRDRMPLAITRRRRRFWPSSTRVKFNQPMFKLRRGNYSTQSWRS